MHTEVHVLFVASSEDNCSDARNSKWNLIGLMRGTSAEMRVYFCDKD